MPTCKVDNLDLVFEMPGICLSPSRDPKVTPKVKTYISNRLNRIIRT
uniref:Uncharacterized protein n=1 Tax=Arundo donax TaxID=35708 RepID=A0A0A9FLR8_ARUDO